jgi:hypothetical protein
MTSNHVPLAARRTIALGRSSPRFLLELRIIGSGALLTALAVPVGGALLVAALAATGRSSDVVDGVAGLVLEAVCPLGAVLAALAQVGHDRAIESVLATPARYASVMFLRVGIIAALGALSSVLVALAFHTFGAWPSQQSGAGIVLAWAAPMVWLGGLGLLVTVATASSGIGAGLVGGLWLAEILGTDALSGNAVLKYQYLYTTHIAMHGGEWVANRIALLGIGLFALGVAWALLARPARLLTGEAS